MPCFETGKTGVGGRGDFGENLEFCRVTQLTQHFNIQVVISGFKKLGDHQLRNATFLK